MRKNSFLVFIFFLVAQGTIFVALRRYQSFAESKGMLAALEAALVCTTAWLYLASKPRQKKLRTLAQQPSSLEPQKQEEPPSQSLQHSEKKELEETLTRYREGELFSKQRISDLEQEKISLQNSLSDAAQQVQQVQHSVETCCQTIQELTHELERVTSQMEQERRQHAIELRALLRKDDADGLASGKKLTKPLPVQRVAMNPLPTLLLLLSSCQKGLTSQEGADWPSGEHRLLVRRKFFDLAKKLGSSNMAVISFEHPVDCYLSPKISPLISVNDLLELMRTHKPSLDQLKRFEPYNFTDARLGGTTQWTAFRVAWENLDDLFTIVSCR